MNASKVSSVDIVKFNAQKSIAQPDLLAVEEPLEIRIGFGTELERDQKSISVTMRTPGNDFDLVLGFLITEGIIESIDQVHHLKHCDGPVKSSDKNNTVRVELKYGVKLDYHKLERHFYTSSSCGVCGKSSIEAVEQQCKMINSSLQVSNEVISQAIKAMRDKQQVFEYTGGLHAAALFDEDGKLVLMREDVGRHNALDKLIGACSIKAMLPLDKHFIFLSGRTSFELVQKVLVAGAPLVAAVGAPSSLAVQMARDFNLTLIGFAKENRFNVYNGFSRILKAKEGFKKDITAE